MAKKDYLRNEIADLLIDIEEYNEEWGRKVLTNMLIFCACIIGVDGKITAKETELCSDILHIKVRQEFLSQIYEKIDLDAFFKKEPEAFVMTRKIDADEKNVWDESKTQSLLDIYSGLWNVMSEVDISTKKHAERINAFLLTMSADVRSYWDKEGKVIVTKKGNKAKDTPISAGKVSKSSAEITESPKNSKVQNKAGNGTKNTTTTACESSSSPGSWIKASHFIPTGNFLDDVFRHHGLTHDERVEIWGKVITESLPCQYVSDMKYKKAAWLGRDEKCSTSISKLFDLCDWSNKPIYHYSVGFSQSPNMAVYTLAGIMFMHQGIIIHWDQDDFLTLPWDLVIGVRTVKEDKKCYRIFIELVEGIEDLPTEKEGLLFMFPKSGEIPEMIFPNKAELLNLAKLVNTRLSQVEPFRDSPFCIENDHWYYHLTEEMTKKLCEDYIKDKGNKLGKASQSQPPNQEKPTKQVEKIVEVAKPKAAPQGPKKAAGAVSIPTTGSTTKLDFWQAFKPYIDKLRHTEFSQVKIKDDDCLDAKATVIVGVYNSILMRVSKKLLRLELYIDTETEQGNLQILDHIKANIKVPAALKGKIEYERKEGRRAQRVCVSFPGFELTNRSCWAKYITEIMNVTDDFFDAVEAPMHELISGS